ncbi:MAG: bis(5'-nucleosyl)-tetraphosphatase (symmetrical) YqeK [Lachnospiraceae bacterium]|nr:bis(5'-nucleosyl)-tetraphosphatase (symmetrical) YqeK [Lachnospiraceae bacterium]
MKKQLKWKRFVHTMGVAGIASSLAMRYDCDIRQAEEAALLHDCAKYLDTDEMEKLARRAGYSVSPVEKGNASLLHAKAGAALAASKFGVDDPRILEAIRWHTTGKPDMTLLEKIIFVADYIEPGRTTPGVGPIRTLAFTDLDAAVTAILEHTLEYLKETCFDIDEMTQITYEYYRRSTHE